MLIYLEILASIIKMTFKKLLQRHKKASIRLSPYPNGIKIPV